MAEHAHPVFSHSPASHAPTACASCPQFLLTCFIASLKSAMLMGRILGSTGTMCCCAGAAASPLVGATAPPAALRAFSSSRYCLRAGDGQEV